MVSAQDGLQECEVVEFGPMKIALIVLGISLAFILAKGCWEILTASYSKTADDPDRMIKPWS